VNKSKRPVTFSLTPSNEDMFKKSAISFIPDKEMTLKPKEVVNIELRYNPKIKDNEAKKLV